MIFTLSMVTILSVFVTPSVARAVNPAPAEGPTNINLDSPTDYTVTFAYSNPNDTQVRLSRDLPLLGMGVDTTRFQREAWTQGSYHSGGVKFLADMTKDADGYWSVSLPLHAADLSYWYRDGNTTEDWVNNRTWDPASTHPRLTLEPDNPTHRTPVRLRINNDVFDVVRAP
jgi:hypothetical protein